MSSIPAYQASGLASNLDTQGIIDKLVSIEGLPLTALSKKQAGITVQVSTLGALMGTLDSFSSVLKSLASTGLNAVAQVGTNTDFTISGAPPTSASYAVRVQDLARVAKARSTTFANGDAVVTAAADTLSLSVDGTQYDIAVAAGTKLKDLVTQINASTGATSGGTAATLPFSAAVMSDGTSTYLTLTNKKTGFVVGQPASSALTVVHDIGLVLGTPPELLATNAVVHVDGLRVESRSNTLTDVIPGGANLNLKSAHNTEETLVFAPDTGSATGKVQAVVNAYNKAIALIGTQVDNDPASQNTGDKLGSTIALGIQRRMQQFVSTEVTTTGAIRTLRDLGVSLQKDGTLKLDASVLNNALQKDPDACNNVFAKPSSGLSALVDVFVKGQTNPSTGSQMGALVARKNGLDASSKRLTQQAEALQTHLDAYRRQLNIQFTALEHVMSGVNSTARFLDAQSAQLNKK